MSSPAQLFLELAALLDLDDLVAVGDALVHDPPVLDPRDERPWVRVAEWRAWGAERGSRSSTVRRTSQPPTLTIESEWLNLV